MGELKKSIQAEAAQLKASIRVVAGLGKFGNWAEVPWVALFDERANATPTQGVYVVLLFASDGSGVHVSLNQGCDRLRKDLGSVAATKVIKANAERFRAALGLETTIPPDLRGGGARSRLYEAGHVWGRSFDLPLQSEAAFSTALRESMAAYGRLISLEVFDPGNDGKGADDEVGMGVVERKRYRLHTRLERRSGISKKVKAAQGYVCRGCDRGMAEMYGHYGADLIEAHHLKPLATLDEGIPVVLDPKTDFAVLCPNCHAIIHRLPDPSDVAGLRATLSSKVNQS
ncbi:MAG: DUF3578 domain-containing protein [Alphaproteobacteria bacterium]|nr:MAG: DUF3578 domain-containing protein [Alphaproteobacteria bacterium]